MKLFKISKVAGKCHELYLDAAASYEAIYCANEYWTRDAARCYTTSLINHPL